MQKEDKMKRQISWNVPVTEPLDEALEEAVKRDWYRTKAEFIREAVREKLARLGFLERESGREI